MSNYRVKDNTDEVLSAMEKAIERGLKSIGLEAEGYAKEVLTEAVYTMDRDEAKNYQLTGRLRNSITWALSGEEANTKSYEYEVDGETKKAEYSGNAPSDKKKSVYIGTNVEYAAGIELGTHRKAGAVHFLQKAATEHSDKYKKLVEDSMKNA